MPTMDFNLLILLWIIVQIPFSVWLLRASPSREIRRRYRWTVRLRLAIPGKGWRGKIEPVDVEIFEKYRRRLFVQWGVMMGTFTLLHVYLYLKYQ